MTTKPDMFRWGMRHTCLTTMCTAMGVRETVLSFHWLPANVATPNGDGFDWVIYDDIIKETNEQIARVLRA